MALYNDVRSVHATLTGTTADTVVINQLWPALEIINGHATEDLYIRQDGVTAVAAADGTTHIPPGISKVVKAEPVEGSRDTLLSVVGNGNFYSIEGVQ